MKVNAKITMLFSEKGLTIEILDDDSRTRFLEVSLSPEEVCQAFSRLSQTTVTKCEVHGLDKIGLMHENKVFEFPFDWKNTHDDRKKVAAELAIKYCPAGWTPDKYFNSQDSFYFVGDKSYARCTIRRWVKKEHNGNHAIPAE